MAVTIDVPPSRVWPWLVQMGTDRAGWYSWDRLDNFGRRSVERIHPEWQEISVGDHPLECPAMHIRRARVEDAAAIAAVDVASWRAAYRGLVPDAYLDALSVKDKTVSWAASLGREELPRKRTFVVQDGDSAVVGYATIGPDGESGSGLLHLMYVAPTHWGRGAGGALMEAARRGFVESGYRKAVLWVLEANERALRFYEAAGWQADGLTQMNDYGGLRLNALRYVTMLSKTFG